MNQLFLSVLFNALVFICFKWLSGGKAKLFYVVTWNYFFAGFGALLFYRKGWSTHLFEADWFFPTAIMGMAFVFVFYLMAITTREAGASRTAVANKISLIIPVLAALYLYGDHFGIYKLTGLILTVIGLLLMVSGKGSISNPKAGVLIFSLFAISGFLDASIKYIQHRWLSEDTGLAFTGVLFLSACLTGIVSLAVMKITGKAHRLGKEMATAFLPGMVLGLINIGSIYFLVSALQQPGMESSVVFPLNNIGVILISTLIAAVFFREKLEKRNYLGLIMAVLSLFFLFLSNFND